MPSNPKYSGETSLYSTPSVVLPAVASTDSPLPMGWGHDAAVAPIDGCCWMACSSAGRDDSVIPATTTVSSAWTPTSAVAAEYVLRRNTPAQTSKRAEAVT